MKDCDFKCPCRDCPHYKCSNDEPDYYPLSPEEEIRRQKELDRAIFWEDLKMTLHVLYYIGAFAFALYLCWRF